MNDLLRLSSDKLLESSPPTKNINSVWINKQDEWIFEKEVDLLNKGKFNEQKFQTNILRSPSKSVSKFLFNKKNLTLGGIFAEFPIVKVKF